MKVPTALGGDLTFFFADTGFASAGDWSYLTGDSDGPESFPYVLIDGGGDETPSTLNITVTPVIGGALLIEGGAGYDTFDPLSQTGVTTQRRCQLSRTPRR